MAQEKLNNQEPTQSGASSVNDNINFWEDAREFFKSQMPPDFEDNLKQYAVEKGYNENEVRLFNHMLKEVVGFYGTTVLLKLQVKAE
jgi:hypothetical protein